MSEAEVEDDEDGDADALAAGAEVPGVEVAGAEDVELDPEAHAASTRQPTVATTARSILVRRVFMRSRPPGDLVGLL
jgi:hypothetical protein